MLHCLGNVSFEEFVSDNHIDMNEPKAFEKIDYWINNLVCIKDSGHKIKVLIVGNKLDLVDEERRGRYRELSLNKALEHNSTIY